MILCPAGNTEAFKSIYKSFERNGITQEISGILVLSSNDYALKAIHHGTATWVDNYEKKKAYKETKLKKILRNYRIFDFIEKHFGKTVVSVYTFIAYDLLEMGVYYYVKRLFLKLKKGT